MRVEFTNGARTEAIVIERRWWFWRRFAFVRLHQAVPSTMVLHQTSPTTVSVERSIRDTDSWRFVINDLVVPEWLSSVIEDAKKTAIEREPWETVRGSKMGDIISEILANGRRGPLALRAGVDPFDP